MNTKFFIKAFIVISVLAAFLHFRLPVHAEFPFPSAPVGINPYDYHLYCFMAAGMHPNDWDERDGDDDLGDWQFFGEAGVDESVCTEDDPPGCWEMEMEGVPGMRADQAWEVCTGRPDVTVAVLDSGIKWNRHDLQNKMFLNREELPLPEGSEHYDRDLNGAFDVRDYFEDSRVFDANDNGIIDAGDLIDIFSDDVDDDSNGYVDDICGWDFFEEDNDPFDEVNYGHGTGISSDAANEVNNDERPHCGGMGFCPNCMTLPVKVGDSFIVEANDFAEGVIFAVDSGADVIGEALGALNMTGFANEAIEYAYEEGVIVVASAADEESLHHNVPADHPKTLVVNSVRDNELGINWDKSYIMMNGCTNQGARIDVSASSEHCSSEATGNTTGIAGLLVSAAKNSIDRGNMTYYPPVHPDAPDNRPLSAGEIRQIIRMTADDIHTKGMWEFTHLFWRSERFHGDVGWDPYFGFGRINMYQMVKAADSGNIPPEAEIDSPRWWTILDPAMERVQITGFAAAQRSGSFRYYVECAPEWDPRPGDFYSIYASGELTEAQEGVLAELDLGDLASRMPYGVEGAAVDPHDFGRGMPNRFAFTIRVRVVDSSGCAGTAVRACFLHHDPMLRDGFPVYLGGDVSVSPVFYDLNNDGKQELIFATGNGGVHVLKEDGTEPAGWPVYTDPIPLNLGSAAYDPISTHITLPVHAAVLVGAPAIGDIDGDGHEEILVADMEGKVYAWDKGGDRKPGFPVSTDRTYSTVKRGDGTYARDKWNRTDWGFMSQPSLGDIDNDDKLEIIIGALDGHVYAWSGDGTYVPGWPVMLCEPEYVESVEPGTHCVNYIPEVKDDTDIVGRKILGSVSLGDVDGDGNLEVVAATNEGYAEERNYVLKGWWETVLGNADEIVDVPEGNGRCYIIRHDGTLHDGDPSDDDGLDTDAFLEGWPVKVGLMLPEVLPMVGTGINGPAVLADREQDGQMEIAVHSAFGPHYVFNHEGESIYGKEEGKDRTLGRWDDNVGFLTNSTDFPTYGCFGGPIFAEEFGSVLTVISGGGVGKGLDAALTADQLGTDSHITVWSLDGIEGTMLPGFPRQINDMTFFGTPVAADLNHDGLLEFIVGTGVYDLNAVNRYGVQADGWPKLTGGWMVTTPALGDFDGDGFIEIAAGTREGNLFLWETDGWMGENMPWPQHQHDVHNSGCLHHQPPTPVGPTPTPTPTFVPSSLTVKIMMPDHWFQTGDICSLKLEILNRFAEMNEAPLFIALYVDGLFYFWPSWSEQPGYDTINIKPGSQILDIIEPFEFPEVEDSLGGLIFVAAVTDQDLSEITSNLETFEFGFGP